ncbi:hypothetical protein BB561_001584 [Smittium simulii]|uniref:RRM domain-containing protein n=1 Tax=Smittium simulii TaxID=133385 RepID=A0A2T9YU27_9FUNG|nr:hypothetical protein BB561_001584 [Smittium simulii]
MSSKELDLEVDQTDLMMVEEDDSTVTRKGRGFKSNSDDKEEPKPDETEQPQRLTGIHEEAREEDLYDKFGEYGEIKNLHLNLDRKSGFVKGYAFIEYENYKDAKRAVKEGGEISLLGQKVTVSFNFIHDDEEQDQPSRTRRNRERSASPEKRR